MLARSLIVRMRLDLTAAVDDADIEPASEDEYEDKNAMQLVSSVAHRKWIAHPKSLRLSTRPRPALNPDGTRPRTFTRISKSGTMPAFVFGFSHSVDDVANRLVEETLMPMFRKLHPEKSGWNLSLVNVCATSMSLTASDGKDGAGRDIGRMFRRQGDVLKEWKVDDIDMAPSENESDDQQAEVEDFVDAIGNVANDPSSDYPALGSEDFQSFTQDSNLSDDGWDSENDMQDPGESCKVCGAVMPPFAMLAHERFHVLPD